MSRRLLRGGWQRSVIYGPVFAHVTSAQITPVMNETIATANAPAQISSSGESFPLSLVNSAARPASVGMPDWASRGGAGLLP